MYFKGLVQQGLGGRSSDGGEGIGAGGGGRARGGSGESGGNRARGGSGESARARGGSGGKAAGGGGGGVRLVGPEDLEGIRSDGRIRQAGMDAGMNVDR